MKQIKMKISIRPSENELIVEFFSTEDLFRQYEIYSAFRVDNYVIAHEMRKMIEAAVKECNGSAAWWKEVLAEERFSDFSSCSPDL